MARVLAKSTTACTIALAVLSGALSMAVPAPGGRADSTAYGGEESWEAREYVGSRDFLDADLARDSPFFISDEQGTGQNAPSHNGPSSPALGSPMVERAPVTTDMVGTMGKTVIEKLIDGLAGRQPGTQKGREHGNAKAMATRAPFYGRDLMNKLWEAWQEAMKDKSAKHFPTLVDRLKAVIEAAAKTFNDTGPAEGTKDGDVRTTTKRAPMLKDLMGKVVVALLKQLSEQLGNSPPGRSSEPSQYTTQNGNVDGAARTRKKKRRKMRRRKKHGRRQPEQEPVGRLDSPPVSDASRNGWRSMRHQKPRPLSPFHEPRFDEHWGNDRRRPSLKPQQAPSSSSFVHKPSYIKPRSGLGRRPKPQPQQAPMADHRKSGYDEPWSGWGNIQRQKPQPPLPDTKPDPLELLGRSNLITAV